MNLLQVIAGFTQAARNFVKVMVLLMVVGKMTACASLRDFFMNDGQDSDQSSRNIASFSTEDNTSSGEKDLLKAVGSLPEYQENAVGPDLGRNEYANLQRLYNERSRVGYRSHSDPWDGAGTNNEGSLWDPNTQDNFYFTRNMKFRVGDFITLTVDPDMSESINTRMNGLYKPKRKSTRNVIAAEAGKLAGAKVEKAISKDLKNSELSRSVAQDVTDLTQEALEARNRYFTTREIPVRVVEVNNRGQLRVTGTKKLFLRNASFDLTISGLIREDDIESSRMIASSKLMESKVDLTK
jgi:flagellar basal body L-ring protein FlgH